jgi:hypothetical protein
MPRKFGGARDGVSFFEYDNADNLIQPKLILDIARAKPRSERLISRATPIITAPKVNVNHPTRRPENCGILMLLTFRRGECVYDTNWAFGRREAVWVGQGFTLNPK